MVAVAMLPERISSRLIIDRESGCWRWMGSVKPNGYGQVFVSGKRIGYVHRVVFETLVGPIAEGLQLDHLCRVRCCANPAHLELVTPRENTLRGHGPSARNSRRRWCVNGHEFTPENTALRPRAGSRGRRSCRECERAANRRRRLIGLLRRGGAW